MNICIIGSTGAIGNAFLEYYIADNKVTNIYSFSRSKLKIDKASSIKNFQIDIENENSIKKASEEVRGVAFDLVIVATGILHTDEFGPEKSIRDQKKSKSELSTLVAESLAKKAQEKKITKIYFDRGIYKYHGRVKLFAETLRKNGMEF